MKRFHQKVGWGEMGMQDVGGGMWGGKGHAIR